MYILIGYMPICHYPDYPAPFMRSDGKITLPKKIDFHKYVANIIKF